MNTFATLCYPFYILICKLFWGLLLVYVR